MKNLTRLSIAFVFMLISLSGCTSAAKTPQEFAGTSNATDSDEHEYSVQIEGNELKKLTIRQIAAMWGINAQGLLDKVITEYNLKNKYSTDSVLDDMRNEFKFSPAMVKGIAEKMKQETVSR
jgi:hypothetical protein